MVVKDLEIGAIDDPHDGLMAEPHLHEDAADCLLA